MKPLFFGLSAFTAVQLLALLLFYVSGEPFTRTPDHAFFVFMSLVVGGAFAGPVVIEAAP